MKIALLNESFPPMIDGVSVVVSNYAKILNEQGEETFVVVPKTKEIARNQRYKVICVPAHVLNKSVDYPICNPLSLKTLFRIRRERPTVLHVHSPFASAVIARVIRARTNTPIILTYHTKFDYEFDKRLKSKWMRWVATKFICNNISASDEVWVVSEGASESLKKIGYKGKYVVMQNGTDFARGRAEESQVAALKETLGVDGETRLFLFVGRVEWYKGLRLTLNALARLKAGGLKFRFAIVGKGQNLEEIRQYTNEIGLSDNVIFTGPVYDREALRVYYSAADLFLFPSSFDTSGLVVKEAAACGCPSALLAGTCASEGTVHDKNGFICPLDDPDAFAETIRAAVADTERLRQIGEAAAQELYFSFEDAVSQAIPRYARLRRPTRRQQIKKVFGKVTSVGRRSK